MNPIPRNDTNQTGASFAPKCAEVCSGCTAGFFVVFAPTLAATTRHLPLLAKGHYPLGRADVLSTRYCAA